MTASPAPSEPRKAEDLPNLRHFPGLSGGWTARGPISLPRPNVKRDRRSGAFRKVKAKKLQFDGQAEQPLETSTEGEVNHEQGERAEGPGPVEESAEGREDEAKMPSSESIKMAPESAKPQEPKPESFRKSERSPTTTSGQPVSTVEEAKENAETGSWIAARLAERARHTEEVRQLLMQEGISKPKERDVPVDEDKEIVQPRRLVPWEPSDQIYILGNDLPGRYIAHMLAGCESIPPVRYLLPHHGLWKNWEANGRQVTLYRGSQSITTSRIVGEFVRPTNRPLKNYWPHARDEVIQNLVLTVPAALVLKSLEPVVHRLDHRSTICLVQDGLGIVEDIIQAYFPDHHTRPTFVLGQMATRLRHPENGNPFSVAELHQRPLYLSIYTPGAHEHGHPLIKKHPPSERVLRQTHCIRLLTAMPGLVGHGESMGSFLHRKIPTTAFRAIVDPIATILDRTYDKVQDNRYARELMDSCIAEVCDVVSRFPECRDLPAFRRLYLGTSLRKEVYSMLHAQKTADSMMRHRVSRGWESDIDYLTGYFVQRGRALKVPVSALETLLLSVKARQAMMKAQWDNTIRFEESDKPL